MLPSLSLSSSPNSASVKVDKATSEFLMAPDWTINMEICDSVNSDHWMAKEVIKSVKKRLQHKNPRVQMLTLTLLETIVKNCGDNIHFHIAERKVLDEMIKIVKKRTDLQVRTKILVLLDSWQEAFGGPGGKYSQYYWAYDELRRSGVQFPQRASATAPIITPPATQLSTSNPQARLGMSSNSSRRLDEAMASEEVLSLSGMETIRNAMELLADMLQAVNPSDRTSVKDEVIIDLVDRCRANQRKLIEMLATTMDEELLGQGLELNDGLQVLLAKHDAIASGSPVPAQLTSTASSNTKESPTSNLKPSGSRPGESSSTTNAKPAILSQDTMKARAVEEEEEDDEFALIARRHLRSSPVHARNKDFASSSSSNGTTISPSAAPESTLSNALVPLDPPTTAKTTKEQDMVDFLSIVLSTSFSSEPESNQPTPEPAPAQNYSQNHEQPSYVVPWAQAQPLTQSQQTSQFNSPAQSQHQQMQPLFFPQQPSSVQPSYTQPSFAYPPPPWAPTPGYLTGRAAMPQEAKNPNQQPANAGIRPLQHSASFQNPWSPNQLGNSALQLTVNSSPTATSPRALQQMNPMPAWGGSAGAGGGSAAVDGLGTGSPKGQKPYIPSYRLFEELNVFGNIEGKTRSGPYSSASNSSGQSVVGGRR